MHQAYHQWHQSCRELAHHQQQSLERDARKQLLQYQLKELNRFAPQAGEFEQIDSEYKRLANSGQLLTLSQQALQLLADDEQHNMLSQLYTTKHLLLDLIGMDEKLSGLLDMLEEASIQISEASDELRHYADRMDPIPTACMSWNSACRAKSAWHVSTMFHRKNYPACINNCWMSNSCFPNRPAISNT